MRTAILVTIVSALLPACAAAQVAVGAKLGTLGAGVEVTAALGSTVGARFGASGASVSDRRVADDIEYDADADVRAVSATLDWHPGGRGFRVSAGAVYNATEVSGTSLPPPSGIYDIGGVPVPVDLLGTLEGTIEFDPLSPYVGIGWGGAPAAGRGWSAALDLGVLFIGDPDVELDPVFAPGSPIPEIPGGPALLEIALDREERDIEEDLADYDLYPVLSIGVSYRF